MRQILRVFLTKSALPRLRFTVAHLLSQPADLVKLKVQELTLVPLLERQPNYYFIVTLVLMEFIMELKAKEVTQ